jgi:tRNA-Thr(GGU) m(6)t(6)A37 methyltransferase TsaA
LDFSILTKSERAPGVEFAQNKKNGSWGRIGMGIAKTRGERLKLRPIGTIRSTIKNRKGAPKQGSEGAPDAWLEVNSFAARGFEGICKGDELFVVTWLHQGRRDVLQVHPRSDPQRALTGVFATRSPDRPNPLGLHRVTVRKVGKKRLRIGPIEVIDGTPVVDIKPVLSCEPVR